MNDEERKQLRQQIGMLFQGSALFDSMTVQQNIMFPLDMLPWPFDILVQLTPFQYLAYFPSAVFLQKIEGTELFLGLIAEAGWVGLFYTASRLTFLRGIRRYSAFGG